MVVVQSDAVTPTIAFHGVASIKQASCPQKALMIKVTIKMRVRLRVNPSLLGI